MRITDYIYYETPSMKPRHHEEDAGYDLRASQDITIEPGKIALVPTGVSVELLSTSVGYVTGRSSMNSAGIIVLQGVIDPGYRGEIKVVLQNFTEESYHIKKGERIAQMLLLEFQRAQVVEGKAPQNTSRGAKGFGSTGKG